MGGGWKQGRVTAFEAYRGVQDFALRLMGGVIDYLRGHAGGETVESLRDSGETLR